MQTTNQQATKPPIGDLAYVVEQDELHWTVSFQGDRCGRYADRRSALRAAVADAQRVQERGHRIAVLVRRRDGELAKVPDRLLSPAARR